MDQCPRCGSRNLRFHQNTAFCSDCRHMGDIDDFETEQMVDDILVGAIEGGSNYWCAAIHQDQRPEHLSDEKPWYSRWLSIGGTVKVLELEETTWHPLDRAKLEQGIRKAAELRQVSVEEFYENHDAGDADIAVQFAIFGQVIYG